MRKIDQNRSRQNAYRRNMKKSKRSAFRNIICVIRSCIAHRNLARATELADWYGLDNNLRARLGLTKKPLWR